MIEHATFRGKLCLAVIVLLGWTVTPGEAGGLFRRRERAVAPTVQYVAPPVTTSMPTSAPYPTSLGTFYPTPVMTVRGNFPTGGGYSPADSFGDTSLDIYGPLSALRATAAPVLTYTRGYDGRSAILPGTSFSTPDLPGNTPVVYPTQATDYYAPRTTRTPPWWPKATNWIDQN